MTKITEIIPDDLPDWAIDAMAEGQFFNVVAERLKSDEAEIEWLKQEVKRLNEGINEYVIAMLNHTAREKMILYEAIRAGIVTPLPPIPEGEK